MAGEILAQLPEDLRTNEAFTGMNTAGDLANAVLSHMGKAKEFDGKATELNGKVTDLEGKLSKAIQPLPDNATDEQKKLYGESVSKAYRSLNPVPEAPDKYDFGLDPQKYPDQDKDPVLKGFKELAHKLGLPNEVAKQQYLWYDNLIDTILNEEGQRIETAKVEAEKKLKSEFGNDETKYKAARELADRLWKASTGIDFTAFLAENTMIKNPFPILKVIFDLAKKTGEDFSPQSAQLSAGEVQPGMVYNKTVFPKKQAQT